MLLEIQLRNITVQQFENVNFTQTDVAEVIAGHISRHLNVFAQKKDGFFSTGFEFTPAKRKGRTDLTLCMALNDVASARFSSDTQSAITDMRGMEALTCASMKLKPNAVSISAPSLRQE